MGTAHALGIDGADPIIAKTFDRYPVLEPDELWLFAHGPTGTEFERGQIERLDIRRTSLEDVATDPAAAAAATLEVFARDVDRVAVQFDVYVVDFMDLPLSENADRNLGLTLDASMDALAVVLVHPAVAALTVTELNPAHDPDGSAIVRFVERLAGAFPG